MPLNLQTPITYLITSGETSPQTTPATEEYSKVLRLIEAAVAAGIDLVQLREKQLSSRVLFQLAVSAAGITKGTDTRLLVNDRSDIAAGAGADGVHLTAHSLPANVVRRAFGEELLIGVSTHTKEEAVNARRDGADFIVFGPIFKTASKLEYGAPAGTELLQEVSSALASFPIIAIGGINRGNFAECLAAGATGVAAIRMFDDPSHLGEIVESIRKG